MYRLFLDANVLFTAAHNPEGKAAFLFDARAPGDWTLIASPHAIEEARRNISAKYPHCEARLKTLVGRLTLVTQPGPSPISIRLPEKDQPIFRAARAARATHLLTGDLKHLGRRLISRIFPMASLFKPLRNSWRAFSETIGGKSVTTNPLSPGFAFSFRAPGQSIRPPLFPAHLVLGCGSVSGSRPTALIDALSQLAGIPLSR